MSCDPTQEVCPDASSTTTTTVTTTSTTAPPAATSHLPGKSTTASALVLMGALGYFSALWGNSLHRIAAALLASGTTQPLANDGTAWYNSAT